MSIISSEDLDKRDDDNFKKGWNEAIEKAAIEALTEIMDSELAIVISKRIRKLKK